MDEPANIQHSRAELRHARHRASGEQIGGRIATPKFVRDINILVVKSAENLVLSSEQKAYIPACVQKYRDWWVCRTDTNIEIPTDDGHYEVTQTRSCRKTKAAP